MKTYVIVEGQADAEVVTRLLESAPSLDFKILPAGGRSSVLSLARTLLLLKQRPVVAMIDLDDQNAREVRHVFEGGLGQVADPRWWQCVVFAPDIETELLAFLPRTALRDAKTKGSRRARLDDALRSKTEAPKIRALPKIRDAVAFIDQWNRNESGVEAAL